MQSSWAIEFPRAVPPSVRLVGPILPAPAKPLTGEIAEFVRSGDRVLLVSFGMGRDGVPSEVDLPRGVALLCIHSPHCVFRL